MAEITAGLSVGKPRLIGGGERSAIDAVLAEAATRLASCRAAAPNATGTVAVKFTIGSDGAVSMAMLKSSTVSDGAIGTCMAEQFAGLTFPEPRGGGVAIVTYPLLLSAE